MRNALVGLEVIVLIGLLCILGSGCAVVPTQDMHGVAVSASVPFGVESTPAPTQKSFLVRTWDASTNQVANNWGTDLTVIGLTYLGYSYHTETGLFKQKSSDDTPSTASTSATSVTVPAGSRVTIYDVSGDGNTFNIGTPSDIGNTSTQGNTDNHTVNP